MINKVSYSKCDDRDRITANDVSESYRSVKGNTHVLVNSPLSSQLKNVLSKCDRVSHRYEGERIRPEERGRYDRVGMQCQLEWYHGVLNVSLRLLGR